MRRVLGALIMAPLLVGVGCSAGTSPEVLGESVTATPDVAATPTFLSTTVTAPIDPEAAVLEPVFDPDPYPASPDDPCSTLLADGITWCGVVEAGPGRVVWSLDEPRPDDPGRTATVWRATGDGLVASLRAQDPTGRSWGAAVTRSIDLDSDGVDEIVFAFRSTGSSAFVELDVVDASSTSVIHHRSIDGGRLAFTEAGIVFWEASRAPADPVCCPGFYDEWIIEIGPRPLTESLLAPVSAGEVPEGDLPSG